MYKLPKRNSQHVHTTTLQHCTSVQCNTVQCTVQHCTSVQCTLYTVQLLNMIYFQAQIAQKNQEIQTTNETLQLVTETSASVDEAISKIKNSSSSMRRRKRQGGSVTDCASLEEASKELHRQLKQEGYKEAIKTAKVIR